ncbi:MAG: hypothetical protein JSV33_14905 [bacterium]|nr:MAG: hypothetical protein JSV33_14905 [bacterium]
MSTGALSIERDSYIRGRVESRFVSSTPRDETVEDNDVTALLRTYYEYRVWRHVRAYILSSSNDQDSLRKLVQTVVCLGFSILLATSREEAEEVGRAPVTIGLECRRIGSRPLVESSGSGFALGSAPIGQEIALGSSPAETVWTLTIDVELKMAQATVLRQRPDVVDCIMSSLERAVPLNLDYVLRFRVSESDYTMQLIRKDEEKGTTGVELPVVGLNTALGKVRKKDS